MAVKRHAGRTRLSETASLAATQMSHVHVNTCYPFAVWHPVVFLKSGTTPTNVVLRSSMSNGFNVSMVSGACITNMVPQCLKVIYWLIGLWPLGLKYPNIQIHISNSVKSKESPSDGVSMWYTGGMSCRSGVAIGDCGVPTGVPPSDKTTTDSGVQGTTSLCSRVSGGGVRLRVPKICTSDESSGSLTPVSNNSALTVHSGLRMRPCPANGSTDLLHHFL